MQAHPLRTLLVLSFASLIGLIGPLVLDGPVVLACLGLSILPLTIACRPWFAAISRRVPASRPIARRRLSKWRPL